VAALMLACVCRARVGSQDGGLRLAAWSAVLLPVAAAVAIATPLLRFGVSAALVLACGVLARAIYAQVRTRQEWGEQSDARQARPGAEPVEL
jgi:hypothetical protein